MKYDRNPAASSPPDKFEIGRVATVSEQDLRLEAVEHLVGQIEQQPRFGRVGCPPGEAGGGRQERDPHAIKVQVEYLDIAPQGQRGSTTPNGHAKRG